MIQYVSQAYLITCHLGSPVPHSIGSFLKRRFFRKLKAATPARGLPRLSLASFSPGLGLPLCCFTDLAWPRGAVLRESTSWAVVAHTLMSLPTHSRLPQRGCQPCRLRSRSASHAGAPFLSFTAQFYCTLSTLRYV